MWGTFEGHELNTDLAVFPGVVSQVPRAIPRANEIKPQRKAQGMLC